MVTRKGTWVRRTRKITAGRSRPRLLHALRRRMRRLSPAVLASTVSRSVVVMRTPLCVVLLDRDPWPGRRVWARPGTGAHGGGSALVGVAGLLRDLLALR